MRDSANSKQSQRKNKGRSKLKVDGIQNGHSVDRTASVAKSTQVSSDKLLRVTGFLQDLNGELETALGTTSPNPYLNMAAFLMRCQLEGKIVTTSSLTGAAGVPYATARRKLEEMLAQGSIEQRPRTKTGKTFSLHPSQTLQENWIGFTDRILRLAQKNLAAAGPGSTQDDYYFGGSYMTSRSITAPHVLPEPLTLPGGLRILVHGDPTFMVMENLKRQFEQIVGTKINQRAFSIDRLHAEILHNAERPTSRYDIIAVDLPWFGELVEKNILLPLDDILDIERLDPSDFHTAGWKATHWRGRPYGVPSQTTPELLFYRKDWFSDARLAPPRTTQDVLDAARALHNPARGRFGITWNAARGTALGHQFMMACADFGQPMFNLNSIAGGFDADVAHRKDLVPTIDTPQALDATEYLKELLAFSPPDILSMSWFERVRPYAAGKIAMAYGYTLLAPYFELDPCSPAYEQTGYLPHPFGPGGRPLATVGGYALCIPANLHPPRRGAAAEALISFTSSEAQKLYVQNGSRTAPRYSVGADPEVRCLSTVFEAVDAMSWRDELQFWPRPPVPKISEIIRICGEEMHDMLRGISTPRGALKKAQARAETEMNN